MGIHTNFLSRISQGFFNSSNEYGLGATDSSEVSASSYRRVGGADFNWLVSGGTSSNRYEAYFPELSSGESYTANYFLVYATNFGLVYSTAFSEPRATVSAGQMVRIAPYTSGESKGVSVAFSIGG